MTDHGSAAAALTALPEIAREAGVSGYQTCPMSVIDKELNAGRKAGARLIAIGDPTYPAALSLIPDAPPLIWVKGDVSLFERPMVALVGARNASSLGLRMARAVSRDLGAEGFGIVSGMARGIDAAVHEAAIETGTVAVLGGGLDVIYPAENKDLYHKIADTGVIVSEQPMGMKPFARHFPMRNRIVSGMALATVVIEAAAKSGSLLTAGNAMEQGREVMAVPGHPFDGRSSGCNNLLRDGASLIRGSRDVIDVLAHASPLAITAMETPEDALTAVEPQTRSFDDLTVLHSEILSRLGGSAVAEDQLIRDIGARAEDVSSQIMTLELDGQILRKAGGLLARA
jgi:DNA processing protein